MIRNYMRNFGIAIALLSSTLAWTQRQQTPLRLGQVRGQVRLPDGRPASLGIIVELENREGMAVGSAQTDRIGKFEFPSLTPDYYYLRVRAIGFLEHREEIDLVHAVSANVTVELKTDPRTADATGAAPGGVISAETLNAPQGARKNLEDGKQLLLQGKDLDKSIQLFKKAAAEYPAYSEAYVLMGVAYSAEKKWSDASTALNKAIEINANSAPAYIALGALQNNQKDYSGAEKSLLKAVALDPDSADAHLELARTYWAMGRWQDADPHAAKVVQLTPDNAGGHVIMGNILLRKRDAGGALKQFQEALRLAPDSPLAPSIREMVKKIEAATKNQKP